MRVCIKVGGAFLTVFKNGLDYLKIKRSITEANLDINEVARVCSFFEIAVTIFLQFYSCNKSNSGPYPKAI